MALEVLVSRMDRRLLRVIQYINQDLSKQPRLVDLAAIAGLERTYFCRLFHHTVGVTFSTWSRRIRAERAKALLETTDLPIKSIAISVGYADVTTFERNFRKCFECSPRQCRKTQHGEQAACTTTVADKFTSIAENSTTNAETEKNGET